MWRWDDEPMYRPWAREPRLGRAELVRFGVLFALLVVLGLVMGVR